MDSTKAIQVAVARADLAVCAAGRWAVVIVLVLLALVVGLVVVAVLRDPDWIDYDAPCVDITSEGPEGYSEAWFEWEQEGGEHNVTQRHFP